MKIKNLQITSSTLNLKLDINKPICILFGQHSDLILDLIRELIGDHNAKNDPKCIDDGHFVIHSDIEIDGMNYNVCYIRNADFMGDNRIAVNFVPNSLEFSEDDTIEFLEKCKMRNKDSNNIVYNYKIFSIAEDDRPLFVYCEESDDISQLLECLTHLDKPAFVSVESNDFVFNDTNIQTVFIG